MLKITNRMSDDLFSAGSTRGRGLAMDHWLNGIVSVGTQSLETGQCKSGRVAGCTNRVRDYLRYICSTSEQAIVFWGVTTSTENKTHVLSARM